MKEITKLKAIVYLDQNNYFFRYKKLEFIKLLQFIKDEYDVIRATSYNALDIRQENQRKFLTFLSNNGWRCETVDISVNTNIDNILSTDMINDRYVFDHKVVVLLSGDGDFQYPINSLSKAGYKIHVIGIKDNVSLELLKTADSISYIEDIPGVVLMENNYNG